MSRTRYRWWGYVRAMIRNYPAVNERYVQGVALRERMAVQKAIDETERMEDGKERLQLVEMVYFRRTHTLAGAARMIPCSYTTAQRYHAQFVKLVARNFGLLE